ncbi:ATP-dependent helicase [Eubacteriales bacterium OttesenSCG-928-N13]|nr:ATP-dependent helicase [Eubacteriales bacterium OttesenSCG-928-N13]
MNEQAAYLLEQLNCQQKEIVKSSENLIVTACPGSGKTRVLTYKLAYTACQHPYSIKKIVAITYTNRAADEIKDRLDFLDIGESPIWAGTIHQFCLEYILYPYSMSSPRLCKGFKIIDEYIRAQYLDDILHELDIAIPFFERDAITTQLNTDMQITENRYIEVVKRYHEHLIANKEIDFDLILSISLEILTKHPLAAQSISKIIRSIFVDEYQDTNEIQYQIIGKLSIANAGINLLFVGDTDQAIYGSMGGIAKSPEEISAITGLTFKTKTLNGCYRSTQRLIDFYSYFQQRAYKVNSLSEFAQKSGVITLNTTVHKDSIFESISQIIFSQLSDGIPPEEICVIAPQWTLLYPLSKKLRTLLPDVQFDAPDITPIKVDDLNVFYKLSKLIFTIAGEHVPRRKRIASEIIHIFNDEYNISLPDYVDNFWLLHQINSVKPDTTDGIEYYKRIVSHLLASCGIENNGHPQLFETYNYFVEKMQSRIDRYDLATDIDVFRKAFRERKGVVITSCHKIKGEEYNTVIAFGLLQGMIPHWDVIINHPLVATAEAKKMLYVIASRAKESLYLFAEQGRTRRSGYYTLTEILNTYPFDYDVDTTTAVQ